MTKLLNEELDKAVAVPQYLDLSTSGLKCFLLGLLLKQEMW